MPFEIKPGIIKGIELHSLADITSPQQLVVSRKGAMDVPINSDDYVIIEGGEKFSIGDGEPPLVDIPCLRKGIQFSLNGDKFLGDNALDQSKLTGAEIKALDTSGQPTDGLFAELNGFADEPIQDDWRIVVQDKDSFITVPCGNVGDRVSSQIRTFEEQVSEIEHQYGKVEVVDSGQLRLVVVRNFPLPEGWNLDTVDLMLQVPPSYPLAALDMFWASPHIKLPHGGLPDRADVFEQHAEVNWQRFSWHYNGNRWNPIRNSLSSHLKFCKTRLSQLH